MKPPPIPRLRAPSHLITALGLVNIHRVGVSVLQCERANYSFLQLLIAELLQVLSATALVLGAVALASGKCRAAEAL